MTDRELMQQSLEKLEFFAHMKGVSEDTARLIAALRERLAQPEQESVKFNCTVVDDAHPEGVPLSQWKQQQKYKPLAWADMAVRGEDKGLSWTPGHFHKTPLYTAPPDYERGFVDGMQHQMKSSVDKAINKQPTKIFGPNLEEILNRAGFYKKREWVGLTDQEIEDLWNQHERRFDFYSFSCDIEAKLKEKNT